VVLANFVHVLRTTCLFAPNDMRPGDRGRDKATPLVDFWFGDADIGEAQTKIHAILRRPPVARSV